MVWSLSGNKTCCVSIALLSLGTIACESFFDSGFRNTGLYAAPRSGFRVEVIDQGFWNRDSQRVYQAIKLLQICPTAQGKGKPLQLNSRFDEASQADVLTDEAGRSQSVDWRNAEVFLRQTLLDAGYYPLDTLELRGMVRMLNWKGREPGAEVDSITILREDYDGTYDFDRSRPVTEWISPSELQPCSSPAS